MPEQLDLIIGLGNPGPEYLLTRHNAGFWFADALASRGGASFKRDKKLHGETAEVLIAGQRVRLLKPQTYMNESGQSVAAAVAYYKLEPEHILVAYDDIDLAPGRAKLKRGGGSAGHRGIASIMEHVGANFWRLRLGVGHPGRKEAVIGHVLNRAPAGEEELILAAIGEGVEMLPILMEHGADRATQQLHRRSQVQSGETPGSADTGS